MFCILYRMKEQYHQYKVFIIMLSMIFWSYLYPVGALNKTGIQYCQQAFTGLLTLRWENTLSHMQCPHSIIAIYEESHTSGWVPCIVFLYHPHHPPPLCISHNTAQPQPHCHCGLIKGNKTIVVLNIPFLACWGHLITLHPAWLLYFSWEMITMRL